MTDRVVRLVLSGSSAGAIAALEAVGIKAEEVGTKTGAAFGDKLAGKVAGTGGVFQKLGSTVTGLGLPFGNTFTKMGDKVSEADTKGQKLGQTLASIGKVALVAGAAGFAVVAAESIKMAGNFQQSMSKLVTSGGEAASNLKSDMSGVEKLMGQTGTSAEQLSTGLYTINSAGFHAGAGLMVLKAAAEGAKTENADLGSVTDGLTTMLNDYHLKASDAALVTSKMVEATSLGKTTFQDLAGSLHTVSPAANAVGISMNEVLGAMAEMTSKGTPAADAATYLRQTILQLSNPTKKARDEMAALGLSSIDVSQHLGQRGLTGTFDILTNAIAKKMGPAGTVLIDNLKQAAAAGSAWATKLQEMTPAQQAQIKSLADMGVQVDQIKTKIAAGTKATAADKQTMAEYQAKLNGMPPAFKSVLNGLVANKLGFTDLQATIAKLPPTQQTVVGALATMVGGTKSMQAALELTGGSAAEFRDRVTKIGGATTEAGGHVAGWATVQKNFNQQLAEAKGSVEALGIKLGMVLIPFVERAIKAVSSIVGWFEKHKAAAIAVAVVVGGVLVAAVVAYAIAMAQAAIATIAATWPILAIIAALALVGVAIYELVTHWTAVWGAIKAVIGDVVDFIKDHWKTMVEVLLVVVTGGVALIPVLIFRYWSQISAFTVRLWHDVTRFFTQMWRDIVGGVETAVGVVVGFFQRLPGQAVSALGNIWSVISGAFLGIVSHVSSDVIDPIVNYFTSLPGRFVSGLGNIWSVISGAFLAIGVHVDTDVVYPIVNYFTSLPGRFVSGLGNIWSVISGAFLGIVSHVSSDVIDPIVNFFTGLPGRMASIGDHMWDWVVGGLKTVADDIAMLWNNSIGSLSFHIPSWVPGIGGDGFSMPKIPVLDTGGVVSSPTIAALSQNSVPEIVSPVPQLRQVIAEAMGSGGGGSGQPVQLVLDGRVVGQLLWPHVRKAGLAGSARNAVKVGLA